MGTSQEAPALIQYACERCKTRFVLPPSSRQLSLGGKFHALSMGLSRSFRYHEGLGSAYGTIRRQMLGKMDDDAYQSFVQSFRFCHECRQFVCNDCWSMSRRSCLTCVAKSMTGVARPRSAVAATGPAIPRPVVATLPARRGRLRRDATLVALGLAVVLLVVEGGVLLENGGGAAPSPTPPIIAPTQVPSGTPTEAPTETLTLTPAPSAPPSEGPSPSPSASPSASGSASPTPVTTPKPTPTPSPTGTPTPSPTPSPTPTPVPPSMSCPVTVVTNQPFTCTASQVLGTGTWYVDTGSGSAYSGPSFTVTLTTQGSHTITLHMDNMTEVLYANVTAT